MKPEVVLIFAAWIPSIAIGVLISFDLFYLRKAKQRNREDTERIFKERMALRKEREELRTVRNHLQLLEEDLDKLVCREAHLPGDCPMCGAV